MRLAHHLVRDGVSGVYHWRVIVPSRLRTALGVRVLKRSLRTRDPATARAAAYALAVAYSALLENGGSDMVDWNKLGLDPRNFRGFEIKQDPNTGDIFDFKTNGTQHDNAAALHALEIIERMAARKPVAAAAPHTPPQPKGETAKTLADLYLGELAKSALPKTYRIKELVVRDFVEHYGPDKSLAAATRGDVGAWVQRLLASGNNDDKHGNSNRTAANKSGHLFGFFDWAQRRGHYPEGRNPAAKQVKFGKKEKTRLKKQGHGFQPFEAGQIATLYAPDALRLLSTAQAWGAVIGLYTGARVSEVGQLALADFGDHQGQPFFKITGKGEGQSVKTEASEREVPIHPHLVRLGLLERVEQLRAAGETRLFPQLKIGAVNGAGQWLSKAFSRYLTVLHIVAKPPGRYGFHSLRSTAIQALQRLDVEAEIRCWYVGHENGDEHHRTYCRAFLPRIANETKKLDFGLDLDGIRAVLSADYAHARRVGRKHKPARP